MASMQFTNKSPFKNDKLRYYYYYVDDDEDDDDDAPRNHHRDTDIIFKWALND